MSRTTCLANKAVLNKYLWMSRQLRNFNDAGSIMNWAHAMSLVKSLLLETPPNAPVHANRQPSSQPPALDLYPTNNQQRSQTDRSITLPTTICFKPTKRLLSQSPVSCSNYPPSKPSPLTIYTHCQPTVCPTQSAPPCPKRRKIVIPPSVDYHGTTKNQSNKFFTSQPSAIKSIPAPAPSPPDAWIKCYCKKTGRTFYLNKISRVTQMNKPAGFVRNPLKGSAGLLPYETTYPGHDLLGSKWLCGKRVFRPRRSNLTKLYISRWPDKLVMTFKRSGCFLK